LLNSPASRSSRNRLLQRLINASLQSSLSRIAAQVWFASSNNISRARRASSARPLRLAARWLSSRRSESVSTMVFSMNAIILPFQLLQYTSYAVLPSDPNAYLIAYYWNLPSGMLEDPLRVLSVNRKNSEWKSAQLMLGSDQIGHSECVGSVLGVHAMPSAFLLDTHINPSAGCLVILDRNLSFRNALYGWYLAALDDTHSVFQRSEVHFAAVHPAELALYDLKTNREISLFPRKPSQRIRSEYTATLRDFYRNHQEWCNKNNDPCDPRSWTARSKAKLQ